MKTAAIKAFMGALDGIAGWFSRRAKEARRGGDRPTAFCLFVSAYFLYSITATFEEDD